MRKMLPAAALAAAMLLALTACDPMPSGTIDSPSASPSASQPADNGSGTGAFPDDGESYAEGGASGFIGDVMHTYWFDFVVNSAYTCHEFGGYTAAEGKQLLVMDLSLKNTSLSSVPMNDGDFPVMWDEGDPETYEAAFPITTNTETVAEEMQTLVDEWLSDDQFRDEYSLGINETLNGLLIYEVTEGYQDYFTVFTEYFEDGSEGDSYYIDFTAKPAE